MFYKQFNLIAMKMFFLITSSILLLLGFFQVKTARSSGRTEQHQYTVLQAFGDFEVRQYSPGVFARTRVNSSKGSSAAFRVLASYIFGGNQGQQQIAMTAPVAMHVDQGLVMEFMMPSAYTLEELPSPKGQAIELYRKPSLKMAAIHFGGRATDSKIREKSRQLEAFLRRENISHSGKFIYLGYNPPWQLLNRRNEIVVEITE